ncbi:Crp/Fnr family transcriptional regulator [Nocardia sp. BMG111209]|uniref:Crp/Fnr family transcriptional regulator n=1 Tax=Nocardia sp. BMG111209 TaxID=1160137 RepID=UPI0003A6DDA2|nr:Crp/Fnr family transcriptional regulator [Nocardia sp. BMG111209]
MDSGTTDTAEQEPREVWDWPASSLLGGLGKSARNQLLTLGVRVRYPGDRILVRQQENTTFVLVLLDGVVKATARARDGREVLLAVRMGGDLVGEFAAIDDQPRSATVTTCGPTVARLATRAEFLGCLERNPPIALAVNESIVAKLLVANERRIDFTGCDVPTRLARVLHQIAMTYGEAVGAGAVIRWPITQPELATLSGAAEPSVHKALRRLRESGVIATGYRTIRVKDLELLSNIAFRE